jgi:MtN3 and saliva related transmembrane protein
MEPVQLLGWVAAACTTLSFLPQVVHVLRTGDTRAISGWMYLVFCAGVALWLAYGVVRSDGPVIVANGVTLALAGTVLALKARDASSARGGRVRADPARGPIDRRS